MERIIEDKKEDLKRLCKSLRVKRLYAFGSATSGSFSTKSDIDFLFSFVDDISIEDYTENYFLLHYKLRELFNREVDLVTERTLSNPYFIESVNESKQLIYEA